MKKQNWGPRRSRGGCEVRKPMVKRIKLFSSFCSFFTGALKPNNPIIHIKHRAWRGPKLYIFLWNMRNMINPSCFKYFFFFPFFSFFKRHVRTMFYVLGNFLSALQMLTYLVINRSFLHGKIKFWGTFPVFLSHFKFITKKLE